MCRAESLRGCGEEPRTSLCHPLADSKETAYGAPQCQVTVHCKQPSTWQRGGLAPFLCHLWQACPCLSPDSGANASWVPWGPPLGRCLQRSGNFLGLFHTIHRGMNLFSPVLCLGKLWKVRCFTQGHPAGEPRGQNLHPGQGGPKPHALPTRLCHCSA